MIRVGLPSGKVHEIEVESDATVDDVRKKVAELEEINLEQKRIRLIYGGKVYNDGTAKLNEIAKDGAFLHCAISDIKPLGAELESEEEEGRGSRSTVINLGSGEGSAIGFDRLRGAGFTEAEITAIRRHFRQVFRREGDEENGEDNEEISDESARQLEEDWLNSGQDDGPAPRLEIRERHIHLLSMREGSNNDFLAGIVLGFLLGLIMVVLLLDRNLSRKWRIGILAGVGCNLSFGLLRSTLEVQGGLGPP